jgi:hypothetical protein
MNAEQLVKYAARKVEKLWKRQGEIHAMYHYVRSNGTHGVIAAPVTADADKDVIVAFARAVFKTEDVVAYVFVTEIWEAIVLDGEKKPEGSLEHVAGRTEHVMLMGEDDKGMVYGKMEINRPKGREPYLSLLKFDRPGDMEGRMVGLLPQRGSKQ